MLEETLEKKKDLAIAVDEQGWTPLHYAAFYGRASIVTQLLKADKRSAYMGDETDKKTALHIAASKGHVNVMKQLISYCPDCCEVVDQRRRNALHYALEKHQSRITTFVLKVPWLSNILLNAKDVDGNTPLHLLDASHFRTRFIGDARVDKMAFNKENKNALDVIIADDSINENQAIEF
ncbi:ankyrin repeat-containing protein [Prunus yedoensis var. nudiflora]|uniref:Ankyrin repeat-containing protein n=1 Tax=Prunus yedoensis var. nudiflora TaxID=2094558 RepID=A0A314YGP2_PRUYE|nr:ankyrin repeat-containing protein [Prunus yedoensis var. nudiflora]